MYTLVKSGELSPGMTAYAHAEALVENVEELLNIRSIQGFVVSAISGVARLSHDAWMFSIETSEGIPVARVYCYYMHGFAIYQKDREGNESQPRQFSESDGEKVFPFLRHLIEHYREPKDKGNKTPWRLAVTQLFARLFT